MPTFFNPAAGLTANRIPYALGGGRLGDDAGFTFDPVGKTVTVTGALKSYNSGSLIADAIFPAVSLYSTQQPTYKGFRFGTAFTASGGNLDFQRLNTAQVSEGVVSRLDFGTGTWMFGTMTDAANGRLQLASHTTPGGGYGFYDFSLYRTGAGAARLTASLTADGGFIGSGASLTSLPAGQLTGVLPAINGAALTGLNPGQVGLGNVPNVDATNAGNIGSGTLADGRLSANVPLLSVANTFLEDIFLGNGGVGAKWIRDNAGNCILRERYGAVPVTLGDVIAVLKHHGLCPP